MGQLILVDDRKIRQKAYSRVEKLLKKLSRMEANVESYFDRDKRLFNDWFELTFRDQRAQLEALRTQYRDLAEFHNQMHALAEMEGLALAQAAYIIREEERIYQQGTAAERQKIEELRRLREAYVDSLAERQNERARRRRARDQEDEMADSSSQRSDTRAPDPADIEELELLAELTDTEIEEWCADPEVAFLILGKTLKLASFTKNYTLFYRLWELIHPKIQAQFARDFKKSSGVSLYDVIEKLKAKHPPESGAGAGSGSGSGKKHQTGSRESAYQVEQEDEFAQAKPTAADSLKLMYRQLARKLHPDMFVASDNGHENENEPWRKKMWLRVQVAYKEEDLKQLTRLYHLILLKSRELNDFRLSDLDLSHEWLADEIGQTEDYIRSLRRQPAWGFSRRKDLSTVTRKLGRDLDKDVRALETQVTDLRIHHSFLERMGREMAGKSSTLRRHRRRSSR